MKYFKTLETKKYSEPDEKNRVMEIGMRTVTEVFEELKIRLQEEDLMPDEYFLTNEDSRLYEHLGCLPKHSRFICNVDFGGSEGIYLDIIIAYPNALGQRMFANFATGKTLGETTDDFYRMGKISAACSMLLNGNGSLLQRGTEDIANMKKNQ